MITNNNIYEWSMLADPLLEMLIEECASDPYLAEAMRKEDKSMDKCCESIYKKVQENKNGQKCVCISDKDCVRMAKEYFLS